MSRPEHRFLSDCLTTDRSRLPDGHVSLAVSVVFKRPDRTLEAQEAQEAEGLVLQALGRRFGISLRS